MSTFNRQIKILCRVPQPTDAVSMYRGLGPLTALRRQYPIDIMTANDYQWPVLAASDILFMVRPATNMDKQIITHALDLNVKVWVDYDDDVLNVPPQNPAFSYYADQQIQSNIKWIINNATVVSVSTTALSYEFDEYRNEFNSKCVIIPNAFPDHLLNWDASHKPYSNIVTWRGSRTHDADLELAHKMFENFPKDFPNHQMVFIGEPDYRSLKIFNKKDVRVIPSMNIIDYFKLMEELKPRVHIVPLENNRFNRSKSNIAWIEATRTKTAVIAQDLPEFRFVGAFNVNSWDHLNLEAALAVTNVNQSDEYIKHNLLLSIVNKRRWELIQQLI